MESEEPELRECDEAFESDEGNVESYLEEPESSRELLERLKELEVRPREGEFRARIGYIAFCLSLIPRTLSPHLLNCIGGHCPRSLPSDLLQ